MFTLTITDFAAATENISHGFIILLSSILKKIGIDGEVSCRGLMCVLPTCVAFLGRNFNVYYGNEKQKDLQKNIKIKRNIENTGFPRFPGVA